MTNPLRVFVFGSILAASAVVDIGPGGVSVETREAQAVVGRPLTPISFAGVARRSVRRNYYYGGGYYGGW